MDRTKSAAEATYQAAIRFLPAQQSIELQHFYAHGRFPQLSPPRTFSEKIHRRQLDEKDPRFAALSDKVLVKKFVEEKLGPQWLIPTIWSGSALPPRREREWPTPFVIKANHGSGWNLFAAGPPNDDDWDKIERTASLWLSTPWPPHLHEDFYNEIPRQLLVEPRIGPPEGLIDLKCFVFNGRAEYMQVDTDRFAGHKRTFFDREWRVQEFELKYPRDPRRLRPPDHFEQILTAAETLGRGLSFVRVDFYDFADSPKFGEMTFTPGAGLARFHPESADLALGALWPEPSA